MTYKSFPTSAEIYCSDIGDCVATLTVEDQCCIIKLTKPLITTAEDWALFSAEVQKAIHDLKLKEMP